MRIIATFCLSAVLAQAADITGTWTANVWIAGGRIDQTLELKQNGQALTGTIHFAANRDFPLTGTVKGDQIEFVGSKTKYSGTLDGATKISGTVNFLEMEKGTFTATKQNRATASIQEAAAYLQKDPAFQEAMRASATTSAVEPAHAPSKESVDAQNAALAPLLQRLQTEPCDPGFVRDGSVCIQRDTDRERRAAAFKRISGLQEGYVWQFYRVPNGHIYSVIDFSSPDHSLSVADVTTAGYQAFLKPNGEPGGSDLSSVVDTLSQTTLLGVDSSDGARIKRLFSSDLSHSDIEAFVAKGYGTIQIKKVRAFVADETYELTAPSAEGHGGISSMTLTSTGKYIGGFARTQGQSPRKVSASECKQYLLILYDILPNR